MSHTENFQNGQPCWIDISAPDAEKRVALCDFYSTLFGWTFEVGDPEMGFYSIANSEGKPVAGVGQMADVPSVWTTYLATSDVASAAETFTKKGGSVLNGPMQVADVGHFAICQDAVGAMIGLWQPITFAGFARYDEFNAPAWFDQQSPDPKRAADFYRDVFGISVISVPGTPGSMLGTEDHQWFSVSPTPGPEPMPPSWSPVIKVDSLARVTSELNRLGATIFMNDVPVPGGRIVAFADPVVHAPLIGYEGTE